MKLFISFSGGETSAYMAQWLLTNKADHYDEIVCLFANTGQENEQTLEFVERCDKKFGLGVIWVEAVVHHGYRKGTTHKVVNFETANRDGYPFEEMIKKYGIPNQPHPHCTRELKLRPMRSYIRELGWKSSEYVTAIGIRADEIDRVNPKYKESNLIYPLVSDQPMTKPEINEWWDKQDFRLQLKGYEGNCKWCWKKSLRKHLTLLNEHPDWYDFPERMEKLYGHCGTNAQETARVFFRKNQSTQDLRILAKTMDFEPATDDSRQYSKQHELDLSYGCTESCEVDFTDTDENYEQE